MAWSKAAVLIDQNVSPVKHGGTEVWSASKAAHFSSEGKVAMAASLRISSEKTHHSQYVLQWVLFVFSEVLCVLLICPHLFL